ncbi:hypothetical protein DPMN_026648 [Dreissena polymorpha]|uniref:Uncharacterized protein n=1 Tax=Dreissena polymorpha TaxID=45954 RepID=A0A9D4LTU6_DREPO|nr:hypothetical protein DPMN_026648 [Dreissena polymorpha]
MVIFAFTTSYTIIFSDSLAAIDAEEQGVIDTAIAEEPLNDSFVEVEIPGDEPFTCGICDCSYSRKDTLN